MLCPGFFITDSRPVLGPFSPSWEGFCSSRKGLSSATVIARYNSAVFGANKSDLFPSPSAAQFLHLFPVSDHLNPSLEDLPVTFLPSP